MRFQRSLSSVTLRHRIKSEEIRKNWKIEEMIDDIQNYQLKWNLHVLRMPENILPRKALQYRPQVKKGFRKTLPSLGRPVHIVAERELVTQNCAWKKTKKNPNLDRELNHGPPGVELVNRIQNLVRPIFYISKYPEANIWA